ncbi:hypothetical protein KM043_012372 [Ampulex compressa]|nr:hypothetical protein KM043_012372 [Ampulex compressa]
MNVISECLNIVRRVQQKPIEKLVDPFALLSAHARFYRTVAALPTSLHLHAYPPSSTVQRETTWSATLRFVYLRVSANVRGVPSETSDQPIDRVTSSALSFLRPFEELAPDSP